MRRKKGFLVACAVVFAGLLWKESFSEEIHWVNLALSTQGAVATCSAYNTVTGPSTGSAYSASCDQAIDGITTQPGINIMNNTFWGVSNKKIPAWLKIKLKAPATISKIIVKQASAKLTYHIEISEDDKTWEEVVTSSVYKGTSPTTHTFAAVSAKFIRLTVTDADYPKDYNEEDAWAVAIWELEVYEK